MDDEIDPAVGLVVTVKPGDQVTAGQSIAMIHARDESGAAVGRAALDMAIEIGPEHAGTGLPLVSRRVTSDGVETL